MRANTAVYVLDQVTNELSPLQNTLKKIHWIYEEIPYSRCCTIKRINMKNTFLYILTIAHILAILHSAEGFPQFEGLKTYCRNVYYKPGDIQFGLVEGAHTGRAGTPGDMCRDTGWVTHWECWYTRWYVSGHWVSNTLGVLVHQVICVGTLGE